MKQLLLVFAVGGLAGGLLMAACDDVPRRPGATAVGGNVDRAYFIDAPSGRCIEAAPGEFGWLRVVESAACERR